MSARRKLKKSQWIPLGVALYAIGMSCYFGPRLIAEGLSVKFWISVAFEILIVVALFFALRRKEKLADKWTKD